MQSKLWPFITKESNLEKEIVRSGNPADFPASATKASVFYQIVLNWRFGVLAFWQWAPFNSLNGEASQFPAANNRDFP